MIGTVPGVAWSAATMLVMAALAGTASAGVPIDALNSASAGVNPAAAAAAGDGRVEPGPHERRGPAAVLARMAQSQRADDPASAPDVRSPPPLDPLRDR